MSSKLVKQSLKRAKAAAAAVAVANNSSNVGGTMDVSTQNVVRNKKNRVEETKETREGKEGKKEGGRATESGADGRRGGRKSTVGEKETTSGVFCNRSERFRGETGRWRSY